MAKKPTSNVRTAQAILKSADMEDESTWSELRELTLPELRESLECTLGEAIKVQRHIGVKPNLDRNDSEMLIRMISEQSDYAKLAFEELGRRREADATFVFMKGNELDLDRTLTAYKEWKKNPRTQQIGAVTLKTAWTRVAPENVEVSYHDPVTHQVMGKSALDFVARGLKRAQVAEVGELINIFTYWRWFADESLAVSNPIGVASYLNQVGSFAFDEVKVAWDGEAANESDIWKQVTEIAIGKREPPSSGTSPKVSGDQYRDRQDPPQRGQKQPYQGQWNDTVKLRNYLVATYNVDELIILAHDLGLRPDQVIGSTLDMKAMNFLLHLERHDMLRDLVARIGGSSSSGSSRSSDQPMQEIDLLLVQLITQFFDLNEVKSLCFRLRVDYDDLAGDNKSSKVQAMVQHFVNRGDVAPLTNLVVQERPKLYNTLFPPKNSNINTRGGTYVGGNVTSNNFIGGDQIINRNSDDEDWRKRR